MPDRGRERERKRRRRRSFDDDDTLISGWKLGLVIGVIVVCFAMLYPTVIHPMIMSFFGRSSEPPKPPTPSRPPIHPGMRGQGDPRPGGPGGRHDGIHPAMRMAQQQAETQSSGRGMFTWMLPIYTVGVVIFLLYTLFKSKNRRKRRSHYDSSEFSSDDEEYSNQLSKRIGRRKLRGLQQRLKQTEEAMTKILEQLEAVQAVGALIEGEPPSKKYTDDNEKLGASSKVDVKNEQYISDLEKALRDFKILSEAYEEEKGLRRRNSSSEEDEISSEQMHSESDGESGEPVDEPERKANAPEDVSMDESGECSMKDTKSESKNERDSECLEIPVEPAKITKKDVRRRAKKL